MTCAVLQPVLLAGGPLLAGGLLLLPSKLPLWGHGGAESAEPCATLPWYRCRHGEEEVLDIWAAGRQHQFRRPVVRHWLRTGAADRHAGTVVTPMPGKIVKVGGWACCCLSLCPEPLKRVCCCLNLRLLVCLPRQPAAEEEGPEHARAVEGLTGTHRYASCR